MYSAGLDDGDIFHEPQIHVDIPINPSFSKMRIFDPNYISFVGSIDQKLVNEVCKKNGVTHVMKSREGGYCIEVGKYEELSASSLMEYCQIIKSSNKFLCLTSGGATLAAALGVPVLAIYGEMQDKRFHHSPIHTYVNCGKKGCLGYLDGLLLRYKNYIRQLYDL
jgi:hypothetical protein